MIQYHEENEPDYRHAGIDLFLDEAVHGRGLGREAVAVLADHLTRARGHHRLTIDPAADNLRAIACYSAVGFRPVGRLRQYERGSDGSFHDGLLMDALAPEIAAAIDGLLSR
jgi:aminoglycoside 6'-N-acetyltransferase